VAGRPGIRARLSAALLLAVVLAAAASAWVAVHVYGAFSEDTTHRELVVARGTSDPDANAEAMKAARLLAEWTRTDFVDVGFTGVTWPTVPEALERMRRLGHVRVGLFFWFLCTGKLIERARDQVLASGLDVVDAGYFGPDPAVVPIIEQRRDEALHGIARVSCDTCSYRKPWPGMEDRVAQAAGVGHSHLAVEHRHGGHSHHHH